MCVHTVQVLARKIYAAYEVARCEAYSHVFSRQYLGSNQEIQIYEICRSQSQHC